MIPLLLRRTLVGATLSATALTLAVAPSYSADKAPGDWIKPGVPLAGQQHPDPSVVSFGSLLISTATMHGGSNYPFLWSADASTWFARPQYDGRERYLGGETRSGFFNDGIHNPAWGPLSTCSVRANPSCDPKVTWAPGFDYVNGRWVAFSAVQTSASRRYSSYGRFAIYRALAATPWGLYRSASSSPIVKSDVRRDPAGVLDPEVFVEPSSNGRAYLLYKTEGNKHGNWPALWSRQLSSAGTSFAKGSRPKRLLTVKPGTWEGRVIENPSMAKVNGRYLLFYSGNEYSTSRYATGYASCTGPLGPCTRKGRLLTSQRGSYGPGGADAVTDDRGRSLLAYHAYPRDGGSKTRGNGRVLRTAEYTVDSRGTVRIAQRNVAAAPGSAGQVWYGQGGGGFDAVSRDVDDSYSPYAVDADHDGVDDLGLYGRWSRADRVIRGGAGQRSLPSGAIDGQAGAFVPVTGDFDGNGSRDVYWYDPGAGTVFDYARAKKFEPSARKESLWLSMPAGWSKRTEQDTGLHQDRLAIPYTGDFDGDGKDEIRWYQPGAASDEAWEYDRGKGTFVRSSITVRAPGTSAPTVGDLDGDGKDDLLWYVRGTSQAQVWWSGSATSTTRFAVGAETQRSGRRPVVGDFDGDRRAEVLWYGPRAVSEEIWRGVERSGAVRRGTSARQLDGGAVYQPVVGDFDDDGKDDVVWYG